MFLCNQPQYLKAGKSFFLKTINCRDLSKNYLIIVPDSDRAGSVIVP